MIEYCTWLARKLGPSCCVKGILALVLCIILYYYCAPSVKINSPAHTDSIGGEELPLPLVSPPVHTPPPPWELSDEARGVGGYAMQGRRPTMEDRMEVTGLGGKGEGVATFAVLDGHGGELAVDFVRRVTFEKLRSHFDVAKQKRDGDVGGRSGVDAAGDPSLPDILRSLILSTDKELLNIQNTLKDISGTTLLLAIVNRNEIIVANVGDSRGILHYSDGRTIALSVDHKPNLPAEKARIEEAGGFIAHRGVWRVGGILAMSRALGDRALKILRYITADPDVFTFDLRPPSGKVRPYFLVLASDGLWDTMSNEEAGASVARLLNDGRGLTGAAKSLAMEAYDRGSADNISVMVVRLATVEGALNDFMQGRVDLGG